MTNVCTCTRCRGRGTIRTRDERGRFEMAECPRCHGLGRLEHREMDEAERRAEGERED